MKKRDRMNRKDNVILFPELEKRLLEKGLEKLQQKKFHDAIDLFTDAKSLDPVNGDIYIGLVLAYFESGFLSEAKQLAKEMLQEGIGDYFQIVDLYLMILVQLNEYEEIAATIEVLLEEREIPPGKIEHFSRMLHFSRRMAEGKIDVQAKEATHRELENKELNLFSCHNPKEQMLLVANLSKMNIRPYVEEIKLYLNSEEGHPFLKTMLLNILKEEEYGEEVAVKKFGRTEAVNPVQLSDIREQKQLERITEKLRDMLESEDPVLFENIIGLMERHFFLMYPLKLEPADPSVWAAAYHYLALEYFGAAHSPGIFALKYHVSEMEVNGALQIIRKIEEISYPII